MANIRTRSKVVDTGIVYEVELPGFTKDDISVSFEPSTYSHSLLAYSNCTGTKLSISAKSDTRAEVSAEYLVQDDRLDFENATAVCLNGLMTIEIPYLNKYKGHRILVN